MWQQEQALACPGCGQPRDDVWVFSPEEQDEKQSRWEGKMRKCVACDARERKSHQHHEAANPDRFGVFPVAERTDRG